MWTMIGLLAGGAQAGDVWLIVDDPRRHVEVPAEWFVGGGSSGRLRSAAGEIDLGAEVGRLAAAPVGAARAWPLAEGTLTLVHRDVAPSPPEALRVAFGSGITLDLALEGSSIGGATGPIEASLNGDGLALRVDDVDLLAALRRSEPRALFRGTDRKGRPVVVELR